MVFLRSDIVNKILLTRFIHTRVSILTNLTENIRNMYDKNIIS